MLNVILPSLPYQRIVDPMWQEEMAMAQRHGYTVSLYDAEQEKLYSPLNPHHPSLYRGWMLTASEYQKLETLVPLLVPLAMYLGSHVASGWYDAVAAFTPESYFVPSEERDGIMALVRQYGSCFIKGLSKSYGSDSVVTSLAELEHLIKEHAIGPDDTLFVREFVKLSTRPEQRFFAVRGRVFGAGGQQLPPELDAVLPALQSRWLYTIDVAFDSNGKPLVIEVGDGQVSDTKEWTVAELYETAINHLAKAASVV